MFTWLGAKLTAILSTYVLGVVAALMAAIAPIALTAMTLWVLSCTNRYLFMHLLWRAERNIAKLTRRKESAYS